MAAIVKPTLVIEREARALRQRLGLTAWAALEELLLDAEPRGAGALAACASARSLAVSLGVSKDTAAAAIRRLTATGVVRHEPSRDAATGAFARSVYVLDVDRLAAAGVARRAPHRPASAHHAAAPATGTQGALFDAEQHAATA